jgi:predicted signal transduction protein with EAL and GGDEF domain
LRAATREADTVARLGGDEFAVVADLGAGGPEDATRLARRIVAALEAPFDLGGVTVQVGCSVGIALAPQDAGDPEALMRLADLALYRAKAEGRGCFRFFEAGMDAKIRERAELEADLRLAVARDELEPHFQPLVEISSGRLVGFEMLARWTHPVRGVVDPERFVPIAEDTGLVAAMSERLLRKACRAAAAWPDHLSVAVNISPLQLRDRALPTVVRSALEEAGLPPRRLEIELTESALIGNLELAREIMGDLKALGVHLALDDFGTGYSSLAHLQALPFDKLKIDAGFVHAMANDSGSRKIVAAVVGLGLSLGLPTVAEGVEELEQAEALARLGCDVGQGWLFGHPVPAEAVAALLVERAWSVPTGVAAGAPGILCSSARASDPKLATLRGVVEQWRQHLGSDRVSTRRLIDSATQMHTTTAADSAPAGRQEFARPDFREALLAAAGTNGAINSRNLGNWLRTNQGRVVDGCRIVQDGLREGTMNWRLLRS